MREPAVISLLTPWHHEVLEAFVRDNPGTRVLTLLGSATPDLKRRLAACGGELRSLDETLPPDETAACDAEVESQLSRLETALTSDEWSRLADTRGWSSRRIGDLVNRRAKTDLRDVARTIEILERARISHALRLVIVNEDWTPCRRAVALWARERGIPCLHLSHSLALCGPYTADRSAVSDVVAVFGERGVEDDLDAGAGASAAQIRLTGNPAWDAYPDLVARRETIRADLAAQHDLPASQPWVVFATTWAANLTALCDEGAYGHTLRLFLRACKTLIDGGSQMRIIIKDRPANQAFGSGRVRELVAEVGIDPERVLYALADIDRWIVSADVVVSTGSNASVEALLASTPAINLVTEMDAALDMGFDAESGIVEAEGHELAAALERILDDADHRDRLRAQMNQAAARYNLGFDGSATRRVVDLMGELALPADQRHRFSRKLRWKVSAAWSATAGRPVDAVKRRLTPVRTRYRYPLILLRAMVISDFKLRYQASFLGYLWTLLRPLAIFSILYVVFGNFLRLGDDVPFYAIYLLFGIVLWGFFTETTTQAMLALVARAELLRKINFPRYVVVLSVGAATFISFMLNLLVIALLAIPVGMPVGPEVLWLPFLFLELVALAIAVAFFLSAMFVRYRDLNYIWEVLMQAAFFAIPIVYPLSLVPTRYARIMILNPMAQLIQDARYVLVTDQTLTISQLYGSPWVRVIPVGVTLVLAASSVIYFRRRSPFFAEEA